MNPALLALILFAFYMAIAFGIRTAVHLRATGSTGWRGISGAPFSPSWLGGVLFVFALTLGASAPALALAGIVGNLVDLPAGITWGGTALSALGIVATYGSQVAMGKSWRIGERYAAYCRRVGRFVPGIGLR